MYILIQLQVLAQKLQKKRSISYILKQTQTVVKKRSLFFPNQAQIMLNFSVTGARKVKRNFHDGPHGKIDATLLNFKSFLGRDIVKELGKT